ncbi:MAG TPA: DUF4331 family protein [Micromonosporaceae bacterium]|nr:DUF4331 family protein [Micromonosporaceae bacterium]
MSNHFDGYTAANNAKLDITDTYIFKGTTGTVLVMNTNTPLNASYTGPGWDTDAVYDMRIDINGDARPEIALRARFSGHTHADGSPSAQRWSLSAHLGSGATDPESIGIPLVAGGRTDTVHTTLGGIQAFAGRAGEPFFAPFPLVTKVASAIQTGEVIDWSDWNPDQATNAFANTNINTIVVEIPNILGILNGLTIGYNATVTIPADNGEDWRQVDRAAGSFITTCYGLTGDDRYHEGTPDEDDKTFGPLIERLTRAVVGANGYHPDPAAYAKEVRGRLFPDLMRYRIGTDAAIGQWNGRALDDDATESMFQFFLHKGDIDTGLDISNATGVLRDQFPYVAAPI